MFARPAAFLMSRRRLITVVVTVAALSFIIAFSRPATISQVVGSIGGSGAAVILALYTTTQILRSARIWLALPVSSRPAFRVVVAIVAIHQCLNHLLPMRLGEAGFPLLLKRYAGVPAAISVSLLLVVRFQELVALVVFFGAAAFVQLSDTASDSRMGWLLGFSAVGLFLLVVMIRLLPALLSLAARIFRRRWLPHSFEARKERLAQFADNLQREWRAPVSGWRRSMGWVLTTAIWFNTCYVFLTGLRLSGFDVSYVETVLGSTIASLSHVLPVNAFGSFGSLEAGWTLGFAALGFDARQMLAVGFVLHVLLTLFLMLSALIAWIWLASRTPPAQAAEAPPDVRTETNTL